MNVLVRAVVNGHVKWLDMSGRKLTRDWLTAMIRPVDEAGLMLVRLAELYHVRGVQYEARVTEYAVRGEL